MSATKPGVQTCPYCGIWEIHAEDAFCGWCRKLVGKLRVGVAPSSVFLASEGGEQATQLVIENPTCGAVDVASIFAEGSWVKVVGGGPFTLGPGKTEVRDLVVDTINLASESEADVVVANTMDDARISLLAIASVAKPRLVPNALLLWENDPDASALKRLQIKLDGLRYILSVSSQRPDLIDFVEIDKAALVKPLRELQVQARIDHKRLFRHVRRPPKDVSVEVLIEYEGVDGPTTEKTVLTLRALKPPELEFYTSSDQPDESFKPGIAEIRLSFRNRNKAGDLGDAKDNAPVRIVALDLAPGSPAGLGWVQPLTEPGEIAGGEARDVILRFDTGPFPRGLNHLDVQVRTNRPELDETIHLPFIVKSIKKFDGILAIDFGTSNTCCYSFKNGASNAEPIEIDEKANTSPTFLQYQAIWDQTNLDNNVQVGFADVRIGQRVKVASLASSQAAAATLSRLKQRLGELEPVYVKPITAQDGTLREVRLAVIDYFREIRKAAEKSRHSYFCNFVITHPAVCSLRQHRNMLSAVQEAFGQGDSIPFLQEPIASIIPLVHSRARAPSLRERYFVAAFDFGGGTTDITVAEIVQKRDSSETAVDLRVISSWGQRWGGENLTDFLVERLLKRCEQIAPDRFVLIGKGKSRKDEEERRNELQLQDWAEHWKISFSNGQSYSNSLYLRVRSQDGLSATYEFHYSKLEEPLGSGKTLREEYEEELESRIFKLAGRLKEDLQKRGIDLDVLQLSGKSSAIPQVEVILRKQLSAGCEIITLKADELKECVVKGACLWYELKNSASLILPESLQLTTSRLGRWDDGRFVEILPLCWEIGKPGEKPFRGYPWRAGDKGIVLHENLGELDDRSDDVQALGIFRPVDPDVSAKDRKLTLNLVVDESYWPSLIATTENNEQIPFRLTEDEG